MIKGLNGIRGLAVLFVIFSHVELWQRIGLANNFTRTMMEGDFGVRLFFVLSGFLITHLMFFEVQKNGYLNVKKFWVRRFLRLMPLYYLAITFTFFLDFFGKINLPLCSYSYAYFYAFNFVTSECAWSGFSHFWSLAVEEHFYLIWPLLIYFGFKFGFLFALGLVGIYFYFSDLSSLFGAARGINRWTFPALVPIAIGCLGAYAVRLAYLKDRMGDRDFAGISLIFSVPLIVLPWLWPELAFNYKIMLQSVGVVVLFLYMYFNQSSVLVRVLEWEPLASLGVISYGLYVWQGIFTGNGPYRQFSGWPPSVDAGVFLTFLVAPISYWYFERPFLRLKSRFR